jgi:hypothetical protein
MADSVVLCDEITMGRTRAVTFAVWKPHVRGVLVVRGRK